jgi:pectate lyase
LAVAPLRPHRRLRLSQSSAPVIDLEDDKSDAQQSPLVLYEDGKAIGPAHSVHYDIEYVGRGRYSHWKEFGILMSASDNTDPGKNGRLYWVGLPKQ